jgi:hypothetical protein
MRGLPVHICHRYVRTLDGLIMHQDARIGRMRALISGYSDVIFLFASAGQLLCLSFWHRLLLQRVHTGTLQCGQRRGWLGLCGKRRLVTLLAWGHCARVFGELACS